MDLNPSRIRRSSSTCHASGPVLGLLNHGGNSPAPVVNGSVGGPEVRHV